jgi:hypothetical protein
MKSMLFTLFLVLSQSGCAVYTGASAVSLVSSGKTLTDHTASLVTSADCNAWRATTKFTYYCEYPRDAATTYNRHAY